MAKGDKSQSRIDWAAVVAKARAIVGRYDTGVTLRQLFYQLVSDQTIQNTEYHYQRLSRCTAAARRRGGDPFPDLIDLNHRIDCLAQWDGLRDFADAATPQYRWRRTEGQKLCLWLVVEKAGITSQLKFWFEYLGINIVGLGGFSSQTLVSLIRAKVQADGRPAVLIYAGDHDASGDEILTDFRARTGCWAEVRLVALTKDQVQQYRLPENPGKTSDSRSKKFCARNGYAPDKPVQVELDALPPETLRELYTAAIEDYWDWASYDAALDREERDRERFRGATVSLTNEDDV